MKKFKTESKKMLDMMINSIYTNREIFIREILSNSSDAIDKLYFKSLTQDNIGMSREDFAINISIDKENRIIKVSDNGIGMTLEELENNLGTIAKSGSLDFKKSNDTKNDDINIIGQFGVGFYSVFMVSDKVEVVSKSYDSDQAHCWTSNGIEGYNIAPCQKDSYGTEIIMHIKTDEEDNSFDDYLQEYTIKNLVTKYSNYIRYPIKMMCTKYKTVEDKQESYLEEEILNDMIPLWKKQKSEITEEEYTNFYENIFHEDKPIKTIHTSAEGNINYNALLYIPSTAPYNYYSKDYEKGLKLYTNGVLIMDKCADLLPDHFSFVKGLVDSELSLNISRETIQHDKRLKTIAKNIEKKIKKELENMLKNERESYEKFFDTFGLQLKYGIYSSWGMNKELLQDLIMFYSVKQDKMVTIQEYIDQMQAEQKYIYYGNGKTIQSIKGLPQVERILDKGFDILCMTQEIDEFTIKTIATYNEKTFRSIANEDTGIDDDFVATQDQQKLLEFIKQSLGDEIEKVKISNYLKNHAVCLSSEGDLSIEMEKVFAQMPGAPQQPKAKKVLEINANHKIFTKMQEMLEHDSESLKSLSQVMLLQAKMIAGLSVDNQTELADKIFDLLANS